jgi:hypothetical protein
MARIWASLSPFFPINAAVVPFEGYTVWHKRGIHDNCHRQLTRLIAGGAQSPK